MKKLRTLLVVIFALVVGIVVGRLSAPSVDAKASASKSFVSSENSSKAFRSAGEAKSSSKDADRLPSNPEPAAPGFAYDSSIPLRRTVGENVLSRRIDSWRNVGRTTLDDAIQTQFWAIAGGDMSCLAEGVVLDEAAKEIITKMMANAPATVRAEYTTPEKFTALLLASNFRDVSAFSTMHQRPTSDSETRVVIATYAKDTRDHHGHAASFRKTTYGTWCRVIDEKTVVSLALAQTLDIQPKSLVRRVD
jgi:hypothetical protein